MKNYHFYLTIHLFIFQNTAIIGKKQIYLIIDIIMLNKMNEL